MTISNEGRALLQAKLRALKADKKAVIDKIQILSAQKDSLVAERDALNVRIAALEADLA